MSEAELRNAIRLARLSPDDAQIAIGRLIWRSKWANIGAVISLDRTAAYKRLKYKIIPRLLKVMECQSKAAGA